MKAALTFFLTCVLFIQHQAFALVKYDEGRRLIMGIQLLQDHADPLAYYYLPQFPRLAVNGNGDFEFLCIKYVGEKGTANGGLFHALIEFTLPQESIIALEAELKKTVPGARIAGPVDLMQALKDGENGMGSFEVVSSLLSVQDGKDNFARSVITSGHAPLTPGSKAVVAAILNQQGATLLWNSLTGPTSDVSVSLRATYEAAVKAYNAVVTAEMNILYEHFSQVSNGQEGYSKEEMRRVVDKLRQDGTLKVEVVDRSAGLNIKTSDLDGILSVVTDKLIELMFDAKGGWSKEPDREKAVEVDQIKGRQDRGWFQQTFFGPDNTPYYTDNQYVLKNRKDIRTNTFQLNLSKTTTIRVPVLTSGNIGGLFRELGQDPKYFRIVDLNDPSFQKREVHFQVDGNYLDSFDQLINFATVTFRKVYGGSQADVTRELYFNYADIKAGKTVQVIDFPRLGLAGSDWLNYEYRINWSLKGSEQSFRVPAGEDKWIPASDPAISLIPPFSRRILEIDADRKLLKEAGVASGVIDLAVMIGGKPRVFRTVTLRSEDAESTTRVALYHDAGQEVGYRVTWYSSQGQVALPLKPLGSDYLFLAPPPRENFAPTKN